MVSGNKTICIAGKNAIAVGGMRYVWNKYNSDHKIIAVCDTNDVGVDTWQPSLRKYIKEKGIKEVVIEDVYGMEELVFISLEYHKLIDAEMFNGNYIYNMHFSLLPAYKGMFTSAHPILKNENIGGCTIHKIDSGIDTGNIVFQKKFDISDADTGRDLYDKYTTYGLELVYEKISDLIEGGFEGTPQSNIGSSYFSKKSIDYLNLGINTRCTAYQLISQIKAYSFRDYQLPVMFEKEIFGYEVLEQRSIKAPGTIVNRFNNKFTVATVDYNVDLYFDNYELLLCAVHNQDIKLLVDCIGDNKYVINERNDRGWTPLIISLFNGYNEVSALLLENGADPNKGSCKYTTPLMYAKSYAERTGDMYGIRMLLKHRVSVMDMDIYGLNVFDYLDRDNANYDTILGLLEG